MVYYTVLKLYSEDLNFTNSKFMVCKLYEHTIYILQLLKIFSNSIGGSESLGVMEKMPINIELPIILEYIIYL